MINLCAAWWQWGVEQQHVGLVPRLCHNNCQLMCPMQVQRVPATESAGRVHTSTATVAIMPEVEEVDVQVCFRHKVDVLDPYLTPSLPYV